MLQDRYTSEEYLKNNPTWHVEGSPWKARQIMTMLSRHDVHPQSVCEVGCGAGEILHQLYSRMPENVSFTGYDISPDAITLSRTREKERLTFILGDFCKEKETWYNLVLAIDVIEHVEDYLTFLKRLRVRGEYKLFHIPLDISVQSVLRVSPIMRERRNVGHLHYFTKETALASLADTGYEIIDYFYTPATLDFPYQSVKSLIAFIPRKLLYVMHKDLAARLFGGFSLMVLAR